MKENENAETLPDFVITEEPNNFAIFLSGPKKGKPFTKWLINTYRSFI